MKTLNSVMALALLATFSAGALVAPVPAQGAAGVSQARLDWIQDQVVSLLLMREDRHEIAQRIRKVLGGLTVDPLLNPQQRAWLARAQLQFYFSLPVVGPLLQLALTMMSPEKSDAAFKASVERASRVADLIDSGH